jgi:hypothetical protein
MLQQEETKPKIILMGITGAGKSYQQESSSKSGTNSSHAPPKWICMKGSDGSDIILLDTPGFDDTKTNSEILQIITDLYTMYELRSLASYMYTEYLTLECKVQPLQISRCSSSYVAKKRSRMSYSSPLDGIP